MVPLVMEVQCPHILLFCWSGLCGHFALIEDNEMFLNRVGTCGLWFQLSGGTVQLSSSTGMCLISQHSSVLPQGVFKVFGYGLLCHRKGRKKLFNNDGGGSLWGSTCLLELGMLLLIKINLFSSDLKKILCIELLLLTHLHEGYIQPMCVYLDLQIKVL